MSRFTVLYDACVLYPAPLRDLLMRLATTGTFKARWTNQIHDEWMNSLLKKQPEQDRKKLERTKKLMNQHIYDALIEGYETFVPMLELPDPNDRHVLAAAIKGKCDLIVTRNLKDFPKDILVQYDIEAQHPDDFIWHLINLYPEIVVKIAKEHRADLNNPPYTPEQFLNKLEAQGLIKTLTELRKYKDLI